MYYWINLPSSRSRRRSRLDFRFGWEAVLLVAGCEVLLTATGLTALSEDEASSLSSPELKPELDSLSLLLSFWFTGFLLVFGSLFLFYKLKENQIKLQYATVIITLILKEIFP